jgi:ribosomal protein L16 Arg81 hydroxylase
MKASELMPVLEREGITSPRTWGQNMVVASSVFDPSDMLCSADLEQALDGSLLRWPYFSLVRHGATPEIKHYTLSRNVIGHQRDGFIDPVEVRRLMGTGATLKLNRLADWHRPTREMHHELEAALPVAVSCYVFWTPPESRGMLPHRDGSHVLALQIEGRKKWNLYAGNDLDVRSSAGLDVDVSQPSHEFVLEPGDLLYLPHGWAHDAVAIGDTRSLHLTFTLAEPSPENLIDGFREAFVDQAKPLRERYHALDLPERSERIQDSLLHLAKDLSDQEWVDHALRLMRKEAG